MQFVFPSLSTDPTQPGSVQMVLQPDGTYLATHVPPQPTQPAGQPTVVMDANQQVFPPTPGQPGATQYVDPSNPQVVYQGTANTYQVR